MGVDTAHRTAKLRKLVRALVLKKRIETTHAKAKETSAFADKMVTIAKREGLHARRLLITQIAPLFKGREGGYTRVLRLGYRAGDGAQMALLEWTAVFEAPAKKAKKKKAAKPADKTAEKTSAKEKESAKTEIKKDLEVKEQEEKKDPEKKKGFLGTLRKFFKGDEY